MPESNLSGYWKGVALARTVQTIVHIYLEQRGDQLHGRFEAETPGRHPQKGDLRGSVAGNMVTLKSRDTEMFNGQLAGQPEAYLMVGLVFEQGHANPAGSITLFKQDVTDIPTLLYGDSQEEL